MKSLTKRLSEEKVLKVADTAREEPWAETCLLCSVNHNKVPMSEVVQSRVAGEEETAPRGRGRESIMWGLWKALPGYNQIIIMHYNLL